MSQRRIIIESPFSGDLKRNIFYARRAMNDSLRRGEAPLLPHLLYPQVLDDNDPIQREKRIQAGREWSECAEATVVYCDLGISSEMEIGIQDAFDKGRPVFKRYIGMTENPKKVNNETENSR